MIDFPAPLLLSLSPSHTERDRHRWRQAAEGKEPHIALRHDMLRQLQFNVVMGQEQSKSRNDLLLGEMPARTHSLAPSVWDPRSRNALHGEPWTRFCRLPCRFGAAVLVLNVTGLLAQWPAGGIVGIDEEPVGPEGIQWVRIFWGSGVPHIRIHRSGAAGDGNHLLRRKGPLLNVEILVLGGSGKDQSDAKAESFGVDRL